MILWRYERVIVVAVWTVVLCKAWNNQRVGGFTRVCFFLWDAPRKIEEFPSCPEMSFSSLWGPCTISDWWFGTSFIFPYMVNNHPNRLIFFRGVETTNQNIVKNRNLLIDLWFLGLADVFLASLKGDHTQRVLVPRFAMGLHPGSMFG